MDCEELSPHCPKCGNNKSKQFRKENDVLDVWFDSGASFYYMNKNNSNFKNNNNKCDFYLEGEDQHRGWFQSSLLCSYVTLNSVPFSNLLTHGFVVDECGMILI
jgi:isoleucyl-tRNA synthetase